MDKKSLFTTIKDYNQPQAIKDFDMITFLITALAVSKGTKYQDSFCKRGILSIAQNLERKWDRVEKIMFGTKEEEGLIAGNESALEGETLLESVMDLGVYCILTAVWFKEKPELVQVFDQYKNKSIDWILENMPTDEVFVKEYVPSILSVDIRKKMHHHLNAQTTATAGVLSFRHLLNQIKMNGEIKDEE